AILVPYRHGPLHHTLDGHLRDLDLVTPQWLIHELLALVGLLRNAHLPGLDHPFLHVKLFHQHGHHLRVITIKAPPPAGALELCQSQRQIVAPIGLLAQCCPWRTSAMISISSGALFSHSLCRRLCLTDTSAPYDTSVAQSSGAGRGVDNL